MEVNRYKVDHCAGLVVSSGKTRNFLEHNWRVVRLQEKDSR